MAWWKRMFGACECQGYLLARCAARRDGQGRGRQAARLPLRSLTLAVAVAMSTRTTMSTTGRLPPELIYEVLRTVMRLRGPAPHYYPFLRTSSLVCRAWRVIAQQLLHHTVVLYAPTSVQTRVLQWVDEATDEWKRGCTRELVMWGGQSDAGDDEGRLVAAVRKCERLERLEVEIGAQKCRHLLRADALHRQSSEVLLPLPHALLGRTSLTEQRLLRRSETSRAGRVLGPCPMGPLRAELPADPSQGGHQRLLTPRPCTPLPP